MRKWAKFSYGRYRLQQLNGEACAVWEDGNTGKRRRFRLGVSTEVEGKARLIEFARDVDAAEAGATVGEIWKAYRDDRERDGKQIVTFDHNWKALKPVFAHIMPSQITADLCREYAQGRLRLNRSVGTVWTELNRLRTAMNWAEARNIIPKAPYVWIPSKPDGRTRVLTRDEAARLIEAALMPHVKLFVVLGLATGARSRAILDLTWDKVDFDKGVIHYKREQVIDPLSKAVRKGRASVPMNKLARVALLEAREGALSDHVIEFNGAQVKSVRKGFEAAVRRAELSDDVTPHTLRHTFATWAADADIEDKDVARMLGHSDPKTVRRFYQHQEATSLKHVADVTDLLGERQKRRGKK